MCVCTTSTTKSLEQNDTIGLYSLTSLPSQLFIQYIPLIHSKTKKDKQQSAVVVDLLATTLHSGHVLF